MDKKQDFNYGLNDVKDLFEKLKFEGDRVSNNKHHPYDCFNFFVTALHLHNDWLKHSPNKRFELARKKNNNIKNIQMQNILDALKSIGNGTKHFILDTNKRKKSKVKSVSIPKIDSYYSLFSGVKQSSINIEGILHTMQEFKGLIISFFEWVFDDSIPLDKFPTEIQFTLDSIVLRSKGLNE